MKTMKIKRYSNRKLYSTNDSKYVTLPEIATEMKAGTTINVVDNATGKDITNTVLKAIVPTIELDNDALVNLITKQ